MKKSKIAFHLVSWSVAVVAALVILMAVLFVEFVTPRLTASADVSSISTGVTYSVDNSVSFIDYCDTLGSNFSVSITTPYGTYSYIEVYVSSDDQLFEFRGTGRNGLSIYYDSNVFDYYIVNVNGITVYQSVDVSTLSFVFSSTSFSWSDSVEGEVAEAALMSILVGSAPVPTPTESLPINVRYSLDYNISVSSMGFAGQTTDTDTLGTIFYSTDTGWHSLSFTSIVYGVSSGSNPYVSFKGSNYASLTFNYSSAGTFLSINCFGDGGSPVYSLYPTMFITLSSSNTYVSTNSLYLYLDTAMVSFSGAAPVFDTSHYRVLTVPVRSADGTYFNLTFSSYLISNAYLSDNFSVYVTVAYTDLGNTQHIVNVGNVPLTEFGTGDYYLVFPLDNVNHYDYIALDFYGNDDFVTIINTSSILNSMIADNYDDLLIDYMQTAFRSGYNMGYQVGIESQDGNNLLSVFWAAFEFPFRILFGSYDSDNNRYIGGLFNFTVLGLDIRAFVLSIISVCLIVAIIKLILGSRGGGSNG